MTTTLPLMKNVLKLLAKIVLIPLTLTAAASTTDELDEDEDEESGSLMKGVKQLWSNWEWIRKTKRWISQ